MFYYDDNIPIYISLHNRGGVASNVNVSIDTIRNGDASITDDTNSLILHIDIITRLQSIEVR